MYVCLYGVCIYVCLYLCVWSLHVFCLRVCVYVYACANDLQEDLPADPARVYGGCGWRGYSDWLGLAHDHSPLARYLTLEPSINDPSTRGTLCQLNMVTIVCGGLVSGILVVFFTSQLVLLGFGVYALVVVGDSTGFLGVWIGGFCVVSLSIHFFDAVWPHFQVHSVCVCVCLCEKKGGGEREKERERARERETERAEIV